jgi:hypothetical protein
MHKGLKSFPLALWLLGACAGCTGPAETGGLADELDEALDPTPEYVDEPADEPREPR